MSLDQLVQRTKPNAAKQKFIPLFLPPEYEISIERWRELIQAFNRTDRRVKIADAIKQFLRERYPNEKNFDEHVSMSEIIEVNGRFYTDLYFDKGKPGLTVLLIFKSEDLQLIPITDSKGVGGIRHVTMSYVPT